MQGLKPKKYLGDDFLVFDIEHFVDFDSCTYIPLDKIPVSLLLDPPRMLLLLLTDQPLVQIKLELCKCSLEVGMLVGESAETVLTLDVVLQAKLLKLLMLRGQLKDGVYKQVVTQVRWHGVKVRHFQLVWGRCQRQREWNSLGYGFEGLQKGESGGTCVRF